MVEKGLYYTRDHEWVRVEGTVATVGISDYAQQQLGEITFVELPAAGKAALILVRRPRNFVWAPYRTWT